MTEHTKVERKGQVDLVAVAVNNPATNLLQCAGMVRCIHRQGQFGNPRATRVRRQFGQSFGKKSVGRLHVEAFSPAKDPGTQQGAIRRRKIDSRFEPGAQGVICRQGNPFATGSSDFHLHKLCRQIAHRVDTDGTPVIGEQEGASPVMIEQGETAVGLHDRSVQEKERPGATAMPGTARSLICA